MGTVKQGNSYTFAVERKSNRVKTDLTGYSLDVKILTTSGEETGIEKTVTQLSSDNKSIVVNITPAETQTLEAGSYLVCHKLTNDSIDYAKEGDFILHVEASCFV